MLAAIKRKKGVTLVELAMVIAIVGIIASISSMYIKEVIDLWDFLLFRNEVVSQGRLALSRMIRDIRQVSNSTSVYSAGNSRFEFDDADSNRIEYYISGNNLMRNNDVLLSGVNSLNFTYYDSQGVPITSPVISPGETDIRRLKVQMRIQAGKESKDIRSQVSLRNLGG